MTRFCWGGLAALLALAAATGPARADFLNTIDRGWYFGDGAHAPGNDNYGVGHSGTLTFRNFFVFDLSALSGVVTSARLMAFNNAYASPDLTEAFTLFDVVTPVATLTGTAGGVAAFNDLGAGTVFGSATVSRANNGQYVTVELNAAGLAALNAAAGGTFALGGALTTISSPNNEVVFTGATSGNPADGQTRLEFELSPVAAVPAPPTLVLAAAGGLSLLGYRWRTRRPA